jgi:predicted aconitase with swiveling domain
VAVQFGIIGAEDDGFCPHYAAEMFDLFFAIEHKVGGMFGGSLAGKVRAVRLFMGSASGDAVVLQARELPHAIGLDVGADVVVIEVETAVAVEVAVFAIPWVTLFCTPDLFAGFDIAPKGGRT